MPSESQWTIQSHRVGDIQLGKRLSAPLIASEKSKAKPFKEYIADVQLFEGFEFQDPPLKVGLDPDHKVKMIVIESNALKTNKGIGVGSSEKELHAAYPDTRLHPVPPTFGEDSCAADTKELKDVFFYFRSCEGTKVGSIVRVMMFKQ